MSKTRDPLTEVIRRNLIKFRDESGLSQADAADASGVSLDNLRRYEKGGSGVPATVLQQLATAYGHKAGDFYEENPPAAALSDRPVFFLRTMPGVEVDEAMYKDLVRIIAEKNEIARTRRTKRK